MLRLILIAVLVAGCGAAPATSPALTTCQASMRDAAAVRAMNDTVTDLDPAVRACATFDEWRAAAALYPAALGDADPRTFAENRCREAYLASTALCREVGVGVTVSTEPGEPAALASLRGTGDVAGDQFTLPAGIYSFNWKVSATGDCLFSARLFDQSGATDGFSYGKTSLAAGKSKSGSVAHKLAAGDYALAAGSNGCTWATWITEK